MLNDGNLKHKYEVQIYNNVTIDLEYMDEEHPILDIGKFSISSIRINLP